MCRCLPSGTWVIKHKCHGLNVQVIADLPGGWCGSLRRCPAPATTWVPRGEHRIIDALAEAEVQAVADTAYQGAGPHVAVPQRRRRLDPDTGRYRQLSAAQKQVNTTHARMRGRVSGSTPS